MFHSNDIPRALGIAALAMMFGAGSVHAQSSTSTTTPSGNTSSTTSGTSSTGSTGSSTGTSSSKSMSRADANLMRDLAQANIDEIEAGKLAQSKSQNDQVKQFAQKMIDDHTKALQELQQLAQQKGVKLPTDPDLKHKASAKLLSALEGDKFDKRYLSQGGVTDHRDTHKLLSRVQDRATDPDLKALAAKMLPTVDQHLTMAQEISGEKSATNTSGSSMGSAGTSGTSSSGASGSSDSSSKNTTKGMSGSSNSSGPGK